MHLVSMYYFSQVVGKKVRDSSGAVIGKLKDLIADTDYARPKVVAALLQINGKPRAVDINSVTVSKPGRKLVITCESLEPFSEEGLNTMRLGENVLDRQIVDVNVRKLVRVNDIRLAVMANGTYVIATDVGTEGFLRRLGAERMVSALLKPFGVAVPSHLILWDDVEAINFGHAGIKLKKENSSLNKLHPSDLADILEDMDRNTRLQVFSSLDTEKAADVLEEMDSEARENLLESMPTDMMADLLETMPADEVADILDDVSEEKAEELLNEMENEASSEVRELMEYEDNEVGSLMTTDYVSFKDHYTVEETLNILRETKPESDTIYYLYIVNDEGKLEATVSLRDIVVAKPETKLRDIMKTDIVYVRDIDKIDSINDIIARYNLLAVPVTDEDKSMLGMVIINDIIYNLLKSRRKRI